MNFVNGKIISKEECDDILEHIEEMVLATLRKPPLDPNLVIGACDRLAGSLADLPVIKRLPELGVSPLLAEMYLSQIGRMFREEALRERLRNELGEHWNRAATLTCLHSNATAAQTVAPLGVLFHITAGNVDGLPFVSLLDGLLTGNINIVKLPNVNLTKEEGGITAALLKELFAIAPELREYVYLFDYSSKDFQAMKKLAAVADAVVVWGGDEAVRAVRQLAAPNTRIIEWGHKISFAYVTKGGINRENLEKLAANICLTNQLLCSSCQGVFVDTGDMDEVYSFCAEFLPILEKMSRENPPAFDAGEQLLIQAQVTLSRYHRQIESRNLPGRIFREKNCSLTACSDQLLETSDMYRNLWVKPLPREELLRLRPYKNYLQTAALLCAEGEYEELAQKLLRAGLVKISDGFEMSNYALGEAHDGMFTLRCYTKLVSVQRPR